MKKAILDKKTGEILSSNLTDSMIEYLIKGKKMDVKKVTIIPQSEILRTYIDLSTGKIFKL
jgi:hypothetical protein